MERIEVDPTGQARVEGEADVTLYAGGVYPFRVPVTEAPYRTWHLPVPSAFVTMGAACST
jgi:hypothetical protein